MNLPEEKHVLEPRFDRLTDKSGGLDACWPWTGGLARRQPRISIRNKGYQARIVGWILANGPLPEGRTVTMTCKTHECMNPAHMKLRARQDDVARFWEKVDKSGECWLWRGSISVKSLGYGVFHVGNHSTVIAHRYSWELANGPIPKDDGEWCVCHHCDNPKCVRPEHLFLGRDQDNHDDMVRKGRAGWQKARQNMADAARKAMGVSDER